MLSTLLFLHAITFRLACFNMTAYGQLTVLLFLQLGTVLPHVHKAKPVVSYLSWNLRGLSTEAVQSDISTASESIFVMDDDENEYTNSLPTADHDSTRTEIRRYDSEEEQLLVLKRLRNRSPSPLTQQFYVCPQNFRFPTVQRTPTYHGSAPTITW